MDTPAVVISAILGLLAGWFVVVPVVERIPDPAPLDGRARVAVAVVNAALWAMDVNKFTRWWIAVTYFLIFSTFLALSVVDLRVYRIPDRILFPALGATAVLMVVATFVVVPSTSAAVDILKFAVASMVIYFGILFLFHLASPRGMGFGDVKLALLMGLSMGWLANSFFTALYFVLVALFIGCILGIVFGLTVRLVRRRGGAFPFGPALVAATVYVVMNFQRFIV